MSFEARATYHIGELLANETYTTLSSYNDTGQPRIISSMEEQAYKLLLLGSDMGLSLERLAPFVPRLDTSFQVAGAYYLAKLLRDRFWQNRSEPDW